MNLDLDNSPAWQAFCHDIDAKKVEWYGTPNCDWYGKPLLSDDDSSVLRKRAPRRFPSIKIDDFETFTKGAI